MIYNKVPSLCAQANFAIDVVMFLVTNYTYSSELNVWYDVLHSLLNQKYEIIYKI